MNVRTVCLILLLILGLTYCEKFSFVETGTSEFESTGVITGADPRMCPSPCCGGWFIIIDSMTYEFDSLPEGSDIDLEHAVFPLYVRLNWHVLNTAGCPNKRITIEKIAKD